MIFERYVSSMSRSGTWGDHLTLDAIANEHNVRLWIVESAADYECSVVEPLTEDYHMATHLDGQTAWPTD